MNVLDNLIGVFSPRAAWERTMYRDALRNYEAGRSDRLTPWTTTNGTAEQTDSQYRDIVKARARDLERNNELAEAITGALIRNSIGTGIRPQARIRKKDGTLDKELNKQLEKWWREWIKAKNCDITKQQTFYEFVATCLRRENYDGEVLVKFVTDPKAKIPFKLQGIECDALGSLKTTYNGNYIIAGIELNGYSTPVAYWLQKSSPDGYTSFDEERVLAEDIIHLFKKTRFTQVRGMSEFARIIKRLKETGEYIDAELVAAKIAASYALFVKTQLPLSPVPNGRGQAKDGKRIKYVEPGMIEYLQPGEDIASANPLRNGTNVRDFVEIESRLSAAGSGQSYEVVTRDMSRTNYSSARQNLLEDRKNYTMVQSYLIEHLCIPVWEHFVEACVLAGLVKIPDFHSDKEKYLAADWIAPGWTWIDPLKDVKASKEELLGGLNTFARICAEQGLDWEEVLDQRATEFKRASELGLDLDTFGGGNNAPGTNTNTGT